MKTKPVLVFVPRAKTKPVKLAHTREHMRDCFTLNGVVETVDRSMFIENVVGILRHAATSADELDRQCSKEELATLTAELRRYGRTHYVIDKGDSYLVVSNRNEYIFGKNEDVSVMLGHLDV